MLIWSRKTKKIVFCEGEGKEESHWAFISLVLKAGKSSLQLAQEDNVYFDKPYWKVKF